jgi:hypothetical protein
MCSGRGGAEDKGKDSMDGTQFRTKIGGKPTVVWFQVISFCKIFIL